jgi:hypothetical protein
VPGRRRIGGSGGGADDPAGARNGTTRSVGMSAGSEESSWPQTPQKRVPGGKLAWQTEQRREGASAMAAEDSIASVDAASPTRSRSTSMMSLE